MADKLVSGTPKYTQVVFIPIAVSGTSVARWAPVSAGNGATGEFTPRILAVSSMLTAMALTPTAWIWQQGTTDTDSGTTQTVYAALLRAVIAYQRSLPSRSGDKWMICVDSVSGSSVSTAIQNAQIAVAGDTNNLQGWDCDISMGVAANSDGVHYNDTGNDVMATRADARIRAVL